MTFHLHTEKKRGNVIAANISAAIRLTLTRIKKSTVKKIKPISEKSDYSEIRARTIHIYIHKQLDGPNFYLIYRSELIQIRKEKRKENRPNHKFEDYSKSIWNIYHGAWAQKKIYIQFALSIKRRLTRRRQ